MEGGHLGLEQQPGDTSGVVCEARNPFRGFDVVGPGVVHDVIARIAGILASTFS